MTTFVEDIPAVIREFSLAENGIREAFRDTAVMERKFSELHNEVQEVPSKRRFEPFAVCEEGRGQILGVYLYGLVVWNAQFGDPNARTATGLTVQTAGHPSASAWDEMWVHLKPKHLIVLRMSDSGDPHEIYNGPASLAWGHAHYRTDDGVECKVKLSKLAELMALVPEEQRLPQVRMWPKPEG